MNGINWFYLTGNWTVNFLDLLLFYLIISSLADQQLKLTVKKCVFALIYTVAMGTLSYFIGSIAYHTVFLIVMLFVIKLMTKKAANIRSFTDNILLLVISYLIGMVLSIVTFPFVNLISFIGLSGILSVVIAVSLSITLFLILLQRVDFSGLFFLVVDRIFLKSSISILFLMFILLFAMISFDSVDLLERIALFLFLGIGSTIALFPIIQEIFIKQ